MRTFELYFDDLTPEAQARFLDAAGINDPAEANWDLLPITWMDFEVDIDMESTGVD